MEVQCKEWTCPDCDVVNFTCDDPDGNEYHCAGCGHEFEEVD